jgi:hypothetical protein
MADKTEIKAVCTWGEAEDVTVVGKHTCSWKDRMKSGLIFLLGDPVKKLWEDAPPSPGKFAFAIHGYADDWQLSMTKEEARELGDQLHRAAAHAEELDAGYRDAMEREFERREAHYQETGEWDDPVFGKTED